MSNPNHGLPVAGYRPQSDAAVADAMATEPDVDRRWLAIARTQIEQGFMAANHAVFQQARIALPEDLDE